MPKAVALMFLAGLAACSRLANPNISWGGPGWYLERPHMMIFGRDYYAGPTSYDDCEVARKKQAAADNLLCVNEATKPTPE